MGMNNDLFALPFHEYMARRTKFAVDRMQRDNLIDPVYASIALLQAMWAREYWFKKNEEVTE
jgi:hypothetical protein